MAFDVVFGFCLHGKNPFSRLKQKIHFHCGIVLRIVVFYDAKLHFFYDMQNKNYTFYVV